MKRNNERIPENDKPILTGDKAIASAGFPVDFMAAVHKVADLTGAAISFRAGQPPNTDKGYDVTYKPMAVKTKTFGGNQGIPMLAGFIPMDQDRFGRSGSSPLPKEDFGSSQLKVTLLELVSDAQKGLYNMHLVGNHIEFTPKSDLIDREACANSEAIANSVFRINLIDDTKKIQVDLLSPRTATQVHLSNKPFDEQKHATEPDFWEDRFGDFDQLLGTHFLVEDKKRDEQEFKKTMLLGASPLTGDADGFSFAPPLDYSLAEQTAYEKQYDINKPKDVGEFLAEFVSLLDKYKPGSSSELGLDKLKTVKDFSALFRKTTDQKIKITGLTTPFEACIAHLINVEMQSSPRAKAAAMGQLAQIILHGPETNNPGKPSSLDGDIIHVFPRETNQHINRVVLTRNEQQLVDLVKNEYVGKFQMKIHPKWDKSMWDDVTKLSNPDKISYGTPEVIRKKFGAGGSRQSKSPSLPPSWTRKNAQTEKSQQTEKVGTQDDPAQTRPRTNSMVEMFMRVAEQKREKKPLEKPEVEEYKSPQLK